MLLGHDLTWARCEFRADLATPRAIFKGFSRPRCLLNWRSVLPSLVVAWPVSAMQRIEYAQLRLSRRLEDLHHMRNTPVRFGNTLQTIPYFATLGNKIIVRIDDEKRGDLFVVSKTVHLLSSCTFNKRSLCRPMRLSSALLFGWTLFGNDKSNQALVEGAVVRVLQFDEHFMRTRGKTHQDNWLTARICPHPRSIVDSDMNVSHPRRDSQSIWPKHRNKVQVLRTILNNRHSPRGEWFSKWRKRDDLRWWLFAGERDNRSWSAAVFCALCESRHCVHNDGGD